MNVLKKISLVYTLQVLAVILLFSFAGASSGKEAKVLVNNVTLPSVIDKAKLFKIDKDSAKKREMNTTWNSISEISR